MTGRDDNARQDERVRQLAQIGWLTHFVCVVPLLLGGALYYFAFLAPLSAKEGQLEERITTISTLLESVEDIQAKLDQATRNLDQQQQRTAQVRERIPDQPCEEEYLRSVSEAAMESGVVKLDFKLGGKTLGATFSQIDVSLECEGSYESICRFLDRLEQIPRVARVMSLELTSDSAKTLYPLTLDIRLYYGVHRPLEQNRATAASPGEFSTPPATERLSDRHDDKSGKGGRRG